MVRNLVLLKCYQYTQVRPCVVLKSCFVKINKKKRDFIDTDCSHSCEHFFYGTHFRLVAQIFGELS